jgi:hypothetical protein
MSPADSPPSAAETLPAPPSKTIPAGPPKASKAEPEKGPEKPEVPSFSKPSQLEAAKGYARPYRDAVVHVRRDGGGKELRCPVTILPRDHADFHARQPGVIDRVKCTACRATFSATEFVWNGGSEVVGT